METLSALLALSVENFWLFVDNFPLIFVSVEQAVKQTGEFLVI